MYRYIMIAAAALTLGACGSPCEKAVKASEKCADEAGLETSDDDGADVCEDDDGSNDEYYNCVADAFGNADCSTSDGVTQAAIDSLQCGDAGGTGGTDTAAGS